MEEADLFLKLLSAAIMDAATQNRVTRVNLTVDPDGSGPKKVRVIVLSDDPSTDGQGRG